jgi:hypothetical protein
MTSIFDKIELNSTIERRPLKIKYELSEIDVNFNEPNSIENKYILRLHLSLEFWANYDNLLQVTQTAKTIMVREIHEQLLNYIHRLRYAILIDDKEAADTLCDDIEKEIGLRE